jgi:hypothetical protein
MLRIRRADQNVSPIIRPGGMIRKISVICALNDINLNAPSEIACGSRCAVVNGVGDGYRPFWSTSRDRTSEMTFRANDGEWIGTFNLNRRA